jgi:ribosomal protein S18 acetylase RimI-like enzyme
MMDTITIDRINPATQREIDRLAPGVAQVINTVVAEGDNMALPGRTTADGVRERIRQAGERGGIFYAVERDHVIAFASLQPVEGDPETAALGVWVLPEFRRRGLGTDLSRTAIEFAREAGYTRLRGTIPAENEPALSFFSAIGPIAAIEGGAMRYELPV